MKVRVRFAKYGSMKFIGHLDIMRFFQKAIRRAGIDIRYSEGFSPHQIMSFAAPLGVGMESLGEYMDIELVSASDPQEIKEALNGQMVEGMQILSVSELPDNAKNAMASVAAASYLIHPKRNAEAIEKMAEKLQEFYSQEHIPYTKETKKSVIELDLKEGIYELCTQQRKCLREISSVVAVEFAGKEQPEDETKAVFMLVDASSSGNIRPSMVMEKLGEFAGVSYTEADYQVTRLDTFTRLEKDGISRLVPLGETDEN